ANEAGYNLQGVNSNTSVWEITNPLEPIAITGSTNGGSFQFTRPGDVLREFVAFDYTQFNTPAYVGTVANQNLHALPPTNYLIITNKDLLPAAEELADFHRQLDQKHVTVVTVDKIYNEFSSGGQDIAGIRNFIKMFYDRGSGSNELKNVLLMGAASYDYKDRIDGNTNLVPVYQTLASYHSSMSYSTDEFYAL